MASRNQIRMRLRRRRSRRRRVDPRAKDAQRLAFREAMRRLIVASIKFETRIPEAIRVKFDEMIHVALHGTEAIVTPEQAAAFREG